MPKGCAFWSVDIFQSQACGKRIMGWGLAKSLAPAGGIRVMVGPARFELATSTPPVWRATRLRYGPPGKNDANDDKFDDNLFRSPVTSPSARWL